MRILIVANIPPFANGGAENQARMLAEEFVELGHQVTVVGNEIPKDTRTHGFSFETANIPVFKAIRATRALSFFASLAAYVLRHRNDFDVIYCRFLGEAALSISLVKQIFGVRIPLVPCTACAGETGDAHFLKSLPGTNALVKLVNKQCNAINNISPKIGEELEEIGVDKSLFRFFPNGIRIGKLNSRENVSQPRKIVYLGRLAPQKAIPVLFTALEKMLDSGEQFELHLIGDGPDRAVLEDYVSNSALNNLVHFHGHIENQLLPSVLAQYDFFVLPSLYEGFATATIEAMLAGLPAVVTRSGGPDYFVDEQVGRVCNTNDSEALASSLTEINQLSDTELLAMGERARQRVIERFDIKSLALTYVELFNSFQDIER